MAVAVEDLWQRALEVNVLHRLDTAPPPEDGTRKPLSSDNRVAPSSSYVTSMLRKLDPSTVSTSLPFGSLDAGTEPNGTATIGVHTPFHFDSLDTLTGLGGVTASPREDAASPREDTASPRENAASPNELPQAQRSASPTDLKVEWKETLSGSLLKDGSDWWRHYVYIPGAARPYYYFHWHRRVTATTELWYTETTVARYTLRVTGYMHGPHKIVSTALIPRTTCVDGLSETIASAPRTCDGMTSPPRASEAIGSSTRACAVVETACYYGLSTLPALQMREEWQTMSSTEKDVSGGWKVTRVVPDLTLSLEDSFWHHHRQTAAGTFGVARPTETLSSQNEERPLQRYAPDNEPWAYVYWALVTCRTTCHPAPAKRVTEIVLRKFHADSATKARAMEVDSSDDEKDDDADVPVDDADDDENADRVTDECVACAVDDEMEVVSRALKLRERLMAVSRRDICVVRELSVTTHATQLYNEQVFAENDRHLAPVLQRTSIRNRATGRPVLWWERRAHLQTAPVYTDVRVNDTHDVAADAKIDGDAILSLGRDIEIAGAGDTGDGKRASPARTPGRTDLDVFPTDDTRGTFFPAVRRIAHNIRMPVYNTRKIMWSADGSCAFDVTLANGTVRVNHNCLHATNGTTHLHWQHHNIVVPSQFDYKRREHLVAFVLHDAGPRNPTQYYCPQLYAGSDDRRATRYICDPTEGGLQATFFDPSHDGGLQAIFSDRSHEGGLQAIFFGRSHETRCGSFDSALEEDWYLGVRQCRFTCLPDESRSLEWSDSELITDLTCDVDLEIRQGADVFAQRCGMDDSTDAMRGRRTTWAGMVGGQTYEAVYEKQCVYPKGYYALPELSVPSHEQIRLRMCLGNAVLCETTAAWTLQHYNGALWGRYEQLRNLLRELLCEQAEAIDAQKAAAHVDGPELFSARGLHPSFGYGRASFASLLWYIASAHTNETTNATAVGQRNCPGHEATCAFVETKCPYENDPRLASLDAPEKCSVRRLIRGPLWTAVPAISLKTDHDDCDSCEDWDSREAIASPRGAIASPREAIASPHEAIASPHPGCGTESDSDTNIGLARAAVGFTDRSTSDVSDDTAKAVSSGDSSDDEDDASICSDTHPDDSPFLRPERITFRDIDTTATTDRSCRCSGYFFDATDHTDSPEVQRTRKVAREGFCKYVRQLNYVVRHPTFVACLGNERRIAELRRRTRALKVDGKYAAASSYKRNKYAQERHTVRIPTHPCRVFWNETVAAAAAAAAAKCVEPRRLDTGPTVEEAIASPTLVSEIVSAFCRDARKQQGRTTAVGSSTSSQSNLEHDLHRPSTPVCVVKRRSNDIVKSAKREWAATLRTVASPDITTEIGRTFGVSDADSRHTLQVCCPEFFVAGLWETIKSVVSSTSGATDSGSGDGGRRKTLETTIQRTDRVGRLRDGSSTDENNRLLLATERHNKNHSTAPLLYKLTEDEDGQPCVTELQVIVEDGEVQTHLVNAHLSADTLSSPSSSAPSSFSSSGPTSTSSISLHSKSSSESPTSHTLLPRSMSILVPVSTSPSPLPSTLSTPGAAPSPSAPSPSVSTSALVTFPSPSLLSSTPSAATSFPAVSSTVSRSMSTLAPVAYESTDGAEKRRDIDAEVTPSIPEEEESKEEKKTPLPDQLPSPPPPPPPLQSSSRQAPSYTTAMLDWRQKKCRVDRVRVKSIRRARVDNGRVVYLDEYLRGPCMMCEAPRTTMTSCCRLMLCRPCADRYIKVRTTCCVCARPIDSFFTVDTTFVWRPPKTVPETNTMSRWEADRRYSLTRSWSTISVAERGERYGYVKDAIAEAKLDPNAKPCSEGLHCVTRVDDLVPWFEHFDIPAWTRSQPPPRPPPPKPAIPPHADTVIVNRSSHASSSFSTPRFLDRRPLVPTSVALSVEMTPLKGAASTSSSTSSPSTVKPYPSASPLYLMRPPSPCAVATTALPLVWATPVHVPLSTDIRTSPLAAVDTLGRAPSLRPSLSLGSESKGVVSSAPAGVSSPSSTSPPVPNVLPKLERREDTQVYGHVTRDPGATSTSSTPSLSVSVVSLARQDDLPAISVATGLPLVAPIYPQIAAPDRYAPYQALFVDDDDEVYGTFRPALSPALAPSPLAPTSLLASSSDDANDDNDSASQPLIAPVVSLPAPSVRPLQKAKSRVVIQL